MATARRNYRVAAELVELAALAALVELAAPAVLVAVTAHRLFPRVAAAEIPRGHTTRSTVAEPLTKIEQPPTGLAELRVAILSPAVKPGPGNS